LSLSALSSEQDTQPLTRLVSAVLLFSEENVLEVGSARRFTPADSRVELAGEQGAIAGAMESGEPLLVDEPSIDPELSRIVAFHSCGQVYVFPLRSGFNIYGVLLFGHPDAGFMTRDRQEVLDILGRQAVIAIANARLYQQLVDERDRMVEVQEEARKKLARDLHDGPTQSVSAIAMRVNLARRMIENDPREAGQELGKVEELARRTTKEIRHMLFTLRPLVLESQGLLAALNAMAEKMKETYSQGLNIQVNPQELEQLEIGRQGVIFFIVEEAVNNARKHAQAPHIWVRLRSLDKSMLLLEVQDDGIGFDVEAVNRSYDKRGSLGMINLRERTELINGVLNIQSTPGKGTTVRVAIPLTEEAADRLHQSAARR
ncbi:MAG: GAF domain-containing sensor histidine kinase, partial [Chloroflexi bacterium]|nr:GAF domain-containing sensor histidine kinase [Chloroflexota bacterium]